MPISEALKAANAKRAKKGTAALQSYVGGRGAFGEDLSDALTDLLADLMHMAETWDDEDAFDQALCSARGHYEAEAVYGDDIAEDAARIEAMKD